MNEIAYSIHLLRICGGLEVGDCLTHRYRMNLTDWAWKVDFLLCLNHGVELAGNQAGSFGGRLLTSAIPGRSCENKVTYETHASTKLWT